FRAVLPGKINCAYLLRMRRELAVAATTGEFADDGTYKTLGITEEHQSLVHIVERIVDSRETGCHAALDHHDGVRLVHIENGHAKNRAGGIGARRRIRDVVRTDDQGHV